MELQIGKTYSNVRGEIVTIVSNDIPKDGQAVLVDNIGRSYFQDGRYFYWQWNSDNKFDLVKEVE